MHDQLGIGCHARNRLSNGGARMRALAVGLATWGLLACGDDGGGTAADRLGVGAECDSDRDCLQSHRDGGLSENCLTQFKGGYCGIEDCTASEQCPNGSACVMHEDGHNYCFRLCADKPECNRYRSPDVEANCSSNVEYTGTGAAKDALGKACVPPSSGI